MNEKTRTVQAMQDYILAHIAEEITLADLADTAHFSPWYAHRLFTELTGVSPADYIRKVRLSAAARRLKAMKCRVTDIAMELGFESIDGFDIITLPACEYLLFRGDPFVEEDCCEAITSVQQSMDKYEPSVIGYEWDDDNPRIQLEPRGERGYIELKAVKSK